MSTEKGTAKRRLSSEGTRIEPDTANLDYEQQQHQTQQPTQQQQHQTLDISAEKRPHRPQQASQPAQREASSETADKENVHQPAEGASSVSAGAGTSTWSGSQPISVARSAIASGSAVTVAARAEWDDAPPRQVIAVSASKSPAAFFNLARKFLVTNEMCDLSALEGAIVSAVDAAHLLERSQLASIVRIHTSYVTVEPKRRKQAPQTQSDSDVILIQSTQSESETTASASHPLVSSGPGTTPTTPQTAPDSGDSKPAATPAEAVPAAVAGPIVAPTSQTSASSTTRQGGPRSSTGGRELRRARIVVTVRRTESYKRWLEENPLQAIIASEVDDDTMDAALEGPTPPLA